MTQAENNTTVASEEKAIVPPKPLSGLYLEECISLNKNSIDFLTLLPGMIKEEIFIIENNFADRDITFRIQVDCFHKEFDLLEEYVYSI